MFWHATEKRPERRAANAGERRDDHALERRHDGDACVHDVAVAECADEAGDLTSAETNADDEEACLGYNL